MSMPPTDDLRQPPPDPLAGLRELLGPSARPDSLGRLGHYEVLKLLGRGGFGTVLLAVDAKLEREVAIKVLDPKHGANSVAGVRFLREARASAPLRHENVVQIYAVEERPTPYLVMEFVPGETLHDRVERLGRLPVPEAVAVGTGVARALAAAHARGLVHRDLKPGNVLVERAGGGVRAKLADFGLALSADDIRLTQSGMIVGTPLFMSPEQTRGDELDARSDLFSLGSVLYTAVGGKAPFEAKEVVAVLQRINGFDPRPLQQLNPDAPARLCAAVHKLLAKRPEDRYQSADEAAAALAAVGREMPTHIVAATPASPVPMTEVVRERPDTPDQPVTPADRVRWLLPAAVAAAVMAAVGGGYAVYRGTRPAAAAQPGPGATDAGAKPDTPVEPARKPPGPPLPPGPYLPPPPPLPPEVFAARFTSPDREWGNPTLVPGQVNSGNDERCPTLTWDERTIVFARATHLMEGQRGDRTAAFETVRPLPPEINALKPFSPSLSADGLELAFYAPGEATLNRRVYLARRPGRDAEFGPPVHLPLQLMDKQFFGPVVLSYDARDLLLDLNNPKRLLQFSRADRAQPFRANRDLPGPTGGFGTAFPDWLSPDGRLLIVGRNPGPSESHSYHRRASADAPFGPGQPFDPFPGRFTLGRPWLSPDGERMYFHSRGPDGGKLRLWVSERRPKAK